MSNNKKDNSVDNEAGILLNHFKKYKTEETYATLINNTAQFRKTLDGSQSIKFNELFFNALDFFLFAEDKAYKDGFNECLTRLKAIRQRQEQAENNNK